MIEWVRRHRVALLLAIGIAAYYARFVRHEFALYPLGGQALLRGEPLEVGAPGFTYPPFFAFCMIPFAGLPMWLRAPLWYGVLVASTIGCFRLCERLCVVGEWKPRELFWLRMVTFVLSLKVILAVFENQAYDSVVFLMILAGLCGMMKFQDLRGALGLASAAALKATPLLFFPYLLLRRRVKVFVIAVACYAGFSLLPDVFFRPQGGSSGYFVTWVRNIAGSAVETETASRNGRAARQWETANPLNQSLRSLVYHVTTGTSYAAHTGGILSAVCLGYLLIVTGLLLWPKSGGNSMALDGSLVLMSMLMLSPMSSKSHFVVLMLPFMAATACVIKDRQVRWIGGGLLALSFALTTVTSRDLIGSRLSNLCLSAGCVTFGTLVLLVLLGYIIVKQRS